MRKIIPLVVFTLVYHTANSIFFLNELRVFLLWMLVGFVASLLYVLIVFGLSKRKPKKKIDVYVGFRRLFSDETGGAL